MDSTETARRLLGHGAVSRPYAQLTGGHVANTPIYAELVAEWRAKGHTVPGHREGVWASFAVVTVGDRDPAHAVPFRVPVPLLAAGAWEGAGGASEEAPSQETPETKPPDETSGEGQQAAPEGRPSPATRGATPSGEASEDVPVERSHGAPEVVPLRERPRATPEGTSEASLPEETRGTVPSGGAPEAGSEESRSPETPEAAVRTPSRAVGGRASSEETPGAAEPGAAVPEQAPEPGITSSPDSAPR
ncbi:hypothetical protein ACH4UX_23220 [Streptomyces althioticus]|uniref:Uncharacterized protein n=1 Tax=Streptomyces griseorubens TaxID=66897 RepID=A0ABR4T878_9ACTN|nr:hypothetical protein [Streptomyces griseorubens]KEG43551.1 hypothetical protein DJ64_19745 [Streptomyces griseorubens]